MEIIRFFGSSGVGKDTLIKNIYKNVSLYGKNIVDKRNNIIISKTSIECIGQYPGDPIISMRKNIVNEVLLCNNNDSILIKGQNIDLENKIPEILIKMKHDAIHKIVFLTTTYNKLLNRCRKKIRWNKSYETGGEPAHDKRLMEGQIKKLQKIQGVSFIFIDTSDYKYKVINPLR